MCLWFIGCEGTRPAVKLKTLNGPTLDFGKLEGQWVIINYWASWCKPCYEEIPELNRFYEKYRTKNVQLLGVNYDSVEPRELAKIIQKIGVHYPTLLTDPSEPLGLGDIPGLPATYVFTPTGHLKIKLFGKQTRKSLEAVIGKRKDVS